MSDNPEPQGCPRTSDVGQVDAVASPEIESEDDIDESTLPAQNSPSPASRKARLPIKLIQRMLTLAARGVGCKTISRALNIPVSTVKARLKQFRPILAELKSAPWYASARQEVLTAVELTAVKSMMSPAKHEAASLKDATYCFKAVHTATRLERNLSTNNVEVHKFDPISKIK